MQCPPCNVTFPQGCIPCERSWAMPECAGCFPKQNWFERNAIWPGVISGVIIALATGVMVHKLQKSGVKVA